MKVATWNINSIRARADRLLAWLKTHQPDVLCVQETKCLDEQFPFLELQAAGYRAEHFGQKTYNGVALISKLPIANVRRNLGDGDEQCRVIAGDIGGVTIVCLYAPNGQSLDSPAYAYKLQWYGKLQRWLASAQRPLLVCGDFNIAPDDIDTWDPAIWSGQTLFTPRERAALKELCAANGLVDLFRAKHPEPGRFSWWDYRAGAFRKNQGLRIDHILVTPDLAERCAAVDIDKDARALEGPPEQKPSDHVPVWADLTLTAAA